MNWKEETTKELEAEYGKLVNVPEELMLLEWARSEAILQRKEAYRTKMLKELEGQMKIFDEEYERAHFRATWIQENKTYAGRASAYVAGKVPKLSPVCRFDWIECGIKSWVKK
jgi:hypothetical protein